VVQSGYRRWDIGAVGIVAAIECAAKEYAKLAAINDCAAFDRAISAFGDKGYKHPVKIVFLNGVGNVSRYIEAGVAGVSARERRGIKRIAGDRNCLAAGSERHVDKVIRQVQRDGRICAVVSEGRQVDLFFGCFFFRLFFDLLVGECERLLVVARGQ